MKPASLFFMAFILILVLALLLCSCQKKPGKLESPAPTDETPPTKPLELTSFSFSHTGMAMNDCYSYCATQTEEGVRLEARLNAGNTIVDVMIAEPVLEQLGELAGRLQLDHWNGFSKTNDLVVDGTDFGFSMTLKDGRKISANGSNAFPARYAEALREIQDIFNPLIDEYGNLHPKTLESDDLHAIMLSLASKPQKEFFVRAYLQTTDGRVKLDIQLKNYPGVEDLGEYYFYGTCASFPFEEFQTIVRRYDLPAWNGWNKAAENYNECEWFQMELDYGSEECITAMGTLHPENYEKAKSALLELLSNFIRENKDSFVS